MTLSLVVIGGGPVGIQAAIEAAELGASVTVISEGPLGGRATWASMLPSKVMLTTAEALDQAPPHTAGISSRHADWQIDRLTAGIADRSRAWSAGLARRVERRGINVRPGVARFLGERRLEVSCDEEKDTIPFDRALIASGSVPLFPPGIRPDGERIIAPRFAGHLKQSPQRLVMVGGGVTGCEYAYALRKLGAEVTIVSDRPRLLPQYDADIAEQLALLLRGVGIGFVGSAPVTEIESAGDGVIVRLADGRALDGSHAFVALGRRGDFARLQLEAAGIEHDDSGIATDAHGQTSAAGIYAAGDAAGPPYIVNRGFALARVAMRHALGAPTPPFDDLLVVQAVYTHPPVGQVGLNEQRAAERGVALKVTTVPFEETLRGQITGERGLFKLLHDPATRLIAGAGAVGPGAVDLLAIVALAIAKQLPIDDLAPLYFGHPSWSEVVSEAARQAAQA
jgi:dihydrolipoamide dehydrogenase